MQRRQSRANREPGVSAFLGQLLRYLGAGRSRTGTQSTFLGTARWKITVPLPPLRGRFLTGTTGSIHSCPSSQPRLHRSIIKTIGARPLHAPLFAITQTSANDCHLELPVTNSSPSAPFPLAILLSSTYSSTPPILTPTPSSRPPATVANLLASSLGLSSLTSDIIPLNPPDTMSASLSPEQYGSHQSQSPGDGSEGKSPSGLNLDFFKSLNDKRSNRDGKTPKRRGPKPDSKPALTRRQELNRQAQRTHRERKELYIKALEDEVLRLKEIYSSVSRDREKLAEENRLLKDTLVRNGINVPGGGNGRDDNGNNPSAGSTGFGGGSQGPFSPRQTPSHGSAPSAGGGNYTNPSQFHGNQFSASPPQHIPATKLDVEQAGIDFVLALEKPCMAHLPFLMDRSSGPEGEPCGHALMATCPPAPFKDIPRSSSFAGTDGTIIKKEEAPNQGTWQVTKADLSTLMDLSKRLDLDGEITPVMAWGMIMSHPQFAALSAVDVQRIAEDLGRKVRCYGFGAVMEDFELRDAFESVCSNRLEQMAF